jgi:uncharacterized membrane protein YphA (DoxX/SURF4 family)
MIILATIIETFGSLLVLVGLFTRLAAAGEGPLIAPAALAE